MLLAYTFINDVSKYLNFSHLLKVSYIANLVA